jgi:quinol monooxygenase YgiN
MIAPTRKEEGCIEYRLQQDNETEESFLMIEQWENRDLWQVHMQAEHLKAFVAATEGKLAGITINEMTEVA